MEEEEVKEKVKLILRNTIIDMITSDLVYQIQSFTVEEIIHYLNRNEININKTIERMIEEYSRDGDLELLLHPELIWIREFLYHYID
jgi:hypothetical protein